MIDLSAFATFCEQIVIKFHQIFECPSQNVWTQKQGKCAVAVPMNGLAQGKFSILCYKKKSALIMPHKTGKILYTLILML